MLDALVHQEVRRLARLGMTDTEIARRTGVARSTVRGIRRPRERVTCPRCWLPAKPLTIGGATYAYVLGLYLGDGCIARLPRTYSLRLSLDAKYPGIVSEARNALQCVSGSGRVSEHLAGERKSATVLCVYGQHLPCLLPQHGPGKKHTREIRLELWQEGVVAEHPWLLLRGLIQSDGCRFINRTGKYAYPSYDFSNLSTGIKEIFADACARVGAECRPYKRGVRINAREAVAAFDVHVGPKR